MESGLILHSRPRIYDVGSAATPRPPTRPFQAASLFSLPTYLKRAKARQFSLWMSCNVNVSR